MTKCTAALILCTVLTSVSAYADKVEINNRIDSVLEKCKNGAQNTLATSECYSQATKSWDVELNKQYKLLMADQPEKAKTAIKESQRAWIKYKESYFLAIEAYYREQQGSIWPIMAAESKMNVIREKAIDLNRLLNSTDLS